MMEDVVFDGGGENGGGLPKVNVPVRAASSSKLRGGKLREQLLVACQKRNNLYRKFGMPHKHQVCTGCVIEKPKASENQPSRESPQKILLRVFYVNAQPVPLSISQQSTLSEKDTMEFALGITVVHFQGKIHPFSVFSFLFLSREYKTNCRLAPSLPQNHGSPTTQSQRK